MQLVITTKNNDDYDSLFIIKEGHNQPSKNTGEAVLCGSIIRLEHVNTGKNIHSHKHASFVTESQEVCGFGNNGEGGNFKISIYKILNF
jgi:dolichyl-phosphate-mannose--protein O-mannosyl transferase